VDRLAGDLPQSMRSRLEEVRDLLDRIEGELRRLSHELRPTMLDDLGLVPALQFLAEGVAKRTGLSVEVRGSTHGRLPPAVETALYRIAQEALTNAVRHAHPAHVKIQVQREARAVRCSVADDGVGFDAAREIQKACPRTRTILLTMHGEDTYVLQALQMGIRGYVLKSQAVTDLVRAVREVSRGAVYLSPSVSGAVVEAYRTKKDLRDP